MALECSNCGNGIAQGSNADLCLACQAKLTYCKIDAYQHKEFELINVPWCTKKNKRILYANCHECEYYSEEEILPEVK